MSSDSGQHYDTVASAFLSVSSTMIAIIGSIFPFLRVQGALDTIQSLLFASAILLLIVTIVASVFSLMEREDTWTKRALCKASAIPLIVSTLFLITTMLI